MHNVLTFLRHALTFREEICNRLAFICFNFGFVIAFSFQKATKFHLRNSIKPRNVILLFDFNVHLCLNLFKNLFPHVSWKQRSNDSICPLGCIHEPTLASLNEVRVREKNESRKQKDKSNSCRKQRWLVRNIGILECFRGKEFNSVNYIETDDEKCEFFLK